MSMVGDGARALANERERIRRAFAMLEADDPGSLEFVGLHKNDPVTPFLTALAREVVALKRRVAELEAANDDAPSSGFGLTDSEADRALAAHYHDGIRAALERAHPLTQRQPGGM